MLSVDWEVIATKRFWNRHIVLLTLIPVLAVMIMIFCFSAQNSDDSDALSARITEIVIRIFFRDYDELDEEEQQVLFSRTKHVDRKTAHFTEFAALGFFLLGHFRALALKKGLRRPALGALVTGVLYAVSDELHQGFVSGRAPMLFDVGIDSAGVLFGILVMALLLYLCRAKARQKA